MNPGRYNITVYQGTTFALSPVWKVDNLPVNLTGYSAKMQVRDISNNVIVELSTANGKIVITPGIGQIALALTATQTAALAVGNYNYDLNLTDSASNVYKILEGAFILKASVTN